ncbi:MAG: hypothetical protein KDB61_11005, partial [Planctomycetes bacterium]|nr:hypothetical protein [Planctomycetota bacterium]
MQVANKVASILVWCVLLVPGLMAQDTGFLQDPEEPPIAGNGESTGFGHGLTLFGEWLMVGAPRSYWDGDRAGALWSWNVDTGELQWVPVPGTRDWSSLGWSLDASGEDAILAVGAPGESVGGITAGAVHLFEDRGAGVQWIQRVEPPTLESNAGFGHAVHWNRKELWIASPYASGLIGFQEGAIRRFREGPSGFGVDFMIGSPVPQAGARFGESLLVTDQEILVAAPGQQGGGAVFVFRRGGLTPTLTQILRPHGFGVSSAGFGSSLAMGDGGNGLAIGAPWLGSGIVFLYRRSGDGE